MPKLSIIFFEIFSRKPGNFEEKNEVMVFSIIIINFSITIITYFMVQSPS